MGRRYGKVIKYNCRLLQQPMEGVKATQIVCTIPRYDTFLQKNAEINRSAVCEDLNINQETTNIYYKINDRIILLPFVGKILNP